MLGGSNQDQSIWSECRVIAQIYLLTDILYLEQPKGKVLIGGAMLSDHSEGGKMVGSVAVMDFESIEDAHKFVEADVYVKNKVWKNYIIQPYRVAVH